MLKYKIVATDLDGTLLNSDSMVSEENFAACTSEKKRLVITPGAGHGLCFPVDTESYLAALREFFGE